MKQLTLGTLILIQKSAYGGTCPSKNFKMGIFLSGHTNPYSLGTSN